MSRNARPRRFLHLALTLWVAAWLGACSAPTAQGPSAAEPEPSVQDQTVAPTTEVGGGSQTPALERDRHIEDARAEIASAERVIQQSLGPAVGPPAVTAPPKPGDSKAQEPRPAPAQERGCEPACAALASMRRSTEYVCRLAGPKDDKCVDARTRLRTNEARVTAAQCPCAGPAS